MQVRETPGFGWAVCDCEGEARRVDMRLVGEQQPGTWVLVFIDAAREVIDDLRAQRVRDALRALFGISPRIRCAVREPAAGGTETLEDDPPLSEEEALAKLTAELGARPATEDGA